jgi:CHAT domain-containing protein
LDRTQELSSGIDDPASQIGFLLALGDFYPKVGNWTASAEMLRRAITINSATLNDPALEIGIRNSLVPSLAELHQLRNSKEELLRIEALLDSFPDSEQRIIFLRNSALVHQLMGEPVQAKRDLADAIMEAEKAGKADLHVEALYKLAELYASCGEKDEALSYAEQSLSLAETSEQETDTRSALFVLGQIEMELNQSAEGLAHLNRALQMDQKDGSPQTILEDRLAIANIYVKSGKPHEALKEFQEIHDAIYESKRRDSIIPLELGMGAAFERIESDSARLHYEEALAVLEDTRSSLGGPELYTLFLSGAYRGYYEQIARYYAKIARSRGDAAWESLAFGTIERAKARGLLDILETSILSERPAAELQVIDSLYGIVDEGARSRKERDRLEERLMAMRDIRRKERLGMLAAAPRTATIADVQKALPDGVTLLEYALCDSTSLLWIIDNKTSSLLDLPDKRTIESTVGVLLSALSRPGMNDQALLQSTRTLYRNLIQPAENSIKNAKQLIIVPDGMLFNLPFEVLLTDDPLPGEHWSSQPFLGRTRAPVYVPSAAVYLKMLEAPPRDYALTLVAFGDPDFSMLKNYPRGEQLNLQRLPKSRAEVANAVALLGKNDSRVYLGSEANEANLRRELLSGSPRILLLATHALIDVEDPAFSSVILCPDPAGRENGFLYTLDILTMPFNTDLVVLSACETARGRLGGGEGVVGLSRAFIAAGARSLIASQWAVSDEATAKFMERFFDPLLKERASACEALRKARLSMINDPKYSHPYFWAPFISIGVPDSPWPATTGASRAEK